MYTKQTLNITGKRSITFMGELIAHATNRETSLETRDIWDDVKVYGIDPVWAARQKAKSGINLDPYRVGIAECTRWEGERDRYRVFYARTLPQVLGIVRSHLPAFHREIEEQLRLNNAPTRTLESIC